MESEKINNLLDFLITEAAELYVEKYDVSEFMDENWDDDIEFSEEHKRKMKKLFAECRRRDNFNKMKVYAPKIAAMFVLAILLTNIITFSVEAFRVKFLNTNLNNKGTYTEVSFNKNSYSSDFIEMLYIPEGFKLKKENVSNISSYLKFECGDEYFCFSTEAIEGTTQVDTEKADVKYISLNEKDIMLIEKDNEFITYWNDNNYAYSLYGNINLSEITEIIKNIN